MFECCPNRANNECYFISARKWSGAKWAFNQIEHSLIAQATVKTLFRHTFSLTDSAETIRSRNRICVSEALPDQR